MPKISIIIPFNNVENYISECLETVLNQTLSDIEIIMINDASTDNSLSIVKKYMEADERIKLLEIKERKGQGFARNRGIEIAQGEYIGFVDSDDFVEKNAFEQLYNSAIANNTDISMCQVREYDDINEKYITSDYYSLTPLLHFSDSVFSAEDSKEQILNINVALWNKIYKREYLISIGEKFPEGFIYEDLPFFFGTYLPAKRIHIVWENLYSYRVNRKNSTMQQFNNKILDRLPMVSLTYEKLKKVSFLNDLKQEIQAWIINDLFHRYTLLNENYHKEFFFLMKKVFQSIEIEDIYDGFWKKVYHFEGYLLVMNNSFEDFNQKIFNEYLDIHKVEDRLRSEIMTKREIDSCFGHIYEEITKNYKYTEEIVSEKNKTLYSDIKDLSFVLQDNFVELNKIQDEIQEQNKKIILDINELREENKKQLSLQEDSTKNYVNAKINEISSNIETHNAKIFTAMEKIQENIDKERQSVKEIVEEIKVQFSNVLELQQQKHLQEIAELKEQLKQMEKTLREEMKSPFQKIIEKYNKPEK